ncbi:LysR family transcriptional regulator [Leptolyngbya sp. AN02str]|uniref:LysR family transcriptional regulator n=1 Tax=Leptolyngbya sp. AN02str TaxID=3423363 RepID=UPI003D32136C
MRDNPQNQMKLSQLRILVAVAEHGNFSEAALHLNMSQSAVSHAIAALEEHLGVVLLVRGRHGARLTPVGEQIVPHALQIVSRAEAITKAAELARGLHGGQVRIASFRSVAAHVLPFVIAEFHQQFPEIAVSLIEHDDCPDVEQALQNGEAEIGFTLLPTERHFDSWEILRDEFVALFPASFQPSKPTISWDDLTQQSLVMPPVDYRMMRKLYDHVEQHGYQLKVAYEVGTDAAIVGLVAQGLGATILPRLAAEPIPPNVQVFSLPVPVERMIGAIVRADALHPPAVYAFLDILKKRQVEEPKGDRTPQKLKTK